MKGIKELLAFSTISLIMACGGNGSNGNGSGADVIRKYYTEQHVGNKNDLKFGEIKYLKELTVLDSMNIETSELMPDFQIFRDNVKLSLDFNQKSMRNNAKVRHNTTSIYGKEHLQNNIDKLVGEIKASEEFLEYSQQAMEGKIIDQSKFSKELKDLLANNLTEDINTLMIFGRLNHYNALKKRDKAEVLGQVFYAEIQSRIGSERNRADMEYGEHLLSADSSTYIKAIRTFNVSLGKTYTHIEPEYSYNAIENYIAGELSGESKILTDVSEAVDNEDLVESEELESINEVDYYKINDPDGYSNLRDAPKGEVLQKLYDTEKFEVIGTEGDYKKVKLSNGVIGYVHKSRVVKL